VATSKHRDPDQATGWNQGALPFSFALSMKKLPVDATTIVSIASRPNLYFFYLRAQNKMPLSGRSFTKQGILLNLGLLMVSNPPHTQSNP
jgi:hypothetical protein